MLGANLGQAQALPRYDDIKLEVKEDYTAAANQAALQAANFLLSTPMDGKSIDRLKSLQYVIKWMTGTPEYSFTLDGQATKFAKNNNDLLGLYMVAMTKYVLENPAEAGNQDKIKLHAVKTIVQYASNPANNLKGNKELKKVMDAEQAGKLEAYLNL